MGGTKDYPREYLIASALAATINYPLWRASAIGQSGFVVESARIPALLSPYVHAFAPPYKGALATVLGMTWARAGIFWGSDYGKEQLMQMGMAESAATVLPPLVVSTVVQCVNMPLVRATITIQDPQSKLPNVAAALRYIYQTHGWAGLWHGTSAGVLKSVPKYCTAVVVKGFMEDWLPPPTDPSERLWRSAYKSAAAGIAGAALTNPLDVIRNEMFKTNLELTATVQKLWRELGVRFLARGLGKNMVAVAIPVACTIFLRMLWCTERNNGNGESHERRKTRRQILLTVSFSRMSFFIKPCKTQFGIFLAVLQLAATQLRSSCVKWNFCITPS